MSREERVRAALALDIADRPPAGSWGHDHLAEWSPRDLARVTIAAQRRFGWDFVKFQPRATCFAEAFGARFGPSGDRLREPVLVEPAVKDRRDWGSLPEAGASAPPLADQVEALGLVAAELGAEVPVIQTVFSPLTVAGYLAGKDPGRTVHDLVEEPGLVGRALDRIAGALVDFAARSLEAGAAGVFFAISGYAAAGAMDLSTYRELALPHDLRVLESLPKSAWLNVLHLCGPRLHFDLARDLPLQAVSWSVHEVGNPSLADGIARSGRAAMGGVGQRSTLLAGPRSAIVEEARAAAGANGGRGVIVAPGCSVPPEVSPERLAAVVEGVAA